MKAYPLTEEFLTLFGGISSEDTLYAFDQGMNYFFFSSDLHHIKIEKWFPVELNESVREEILESLFRAWLREQSTSP